MSKSGNKLDDFRAFLYVTDDFGATWTPISGNLPNEPIHVVWEDNKNPDLFFVGSGGGVFTFSFPTSSKSCRSKRSASYRTPLRRLE